jgi:hypothetical protein
VLQVPSLFASSFTKFKAMLPPEGQQQLHWMNWWLKCVPLPDQMHVSSHSHSHFWSSCLTGSITGLGFGQFRHWDCSSLESVQCGA